MVRLLLITPFTPDNQGRGISPTSLLLAELSKEHCVDLVYFRYPEERPYVSDYENVHVLKEFIVTKWQKIIGIIKHPLLFPLFTSRHNLEAVSFLRERVLKVKYDFIYFDFSQTFSYAAYLEHPNKILMSHDVIAQKYSRMKTYLRSWAVWTERRLLKKGKVVFTFSEKDCELIRELYEVNSLSTTLFLHPNVINAEPKEESNYFVFFGSWAREENCESLDWFIDNVYDNLSKEIYIKVIGGGKMPVSLKQKIVTKPNIDYLGFVEDPYPIIANARAEIAPLHMGAGVKVKCVEALGSGTPIIGTEVAFEGIGEQYRSAMFMANKQEEFVKIINSFDFSLEKKKRLKEYFIENYNNKAIIEYINN